MYEIIVNYKLIKELGTFFVVNCLASKFLKFTYIDFTSTIFASYDLRRDFSVLKLLTKNSVILSKAIYEYTM